MAERRIALGALARVEGEGAVRLSIGPEGVRSVALRIFEAPRFFEGILRGRAAAEAPEITARICGICPVAYVLTASLAVERAWGVAVGDDIRALRRLLYCGEWIQSHVLHAALMHAPDFLGLPDAAALARDDPELLRDALRLRAAGVAIIEAVGGRAVHPVNARVGGFFRAPPAERIAALAPELECALDAAERLTARFAAFAFPDQEEDYLFVSLAHPDAYPILDGRIVSSEGLDTAAEDFRTHFAERQVAHSTAMHGRTRDGRPYLVGPLARFANNAARLSPRARAAATAAGLAVPTRNPHRSILVRMVETIHACEEALRLVRGYAVPAPASAPTAARSGVGAACTEAPRGLLWHRYAIGATGRIEAAEIVPPTAQNLPRIEADLAAAVGRDPTRDDAALARLCERGVRNHDPCISCAAHFLSVEIARD